MRKETRKERNARGEKNERREKVGCSEEEKDVRPSKHEGETCAAAERTERKCGEWSGEQPSTGTTFVLLLYRSTEANQAVRSSPQDWRFFVQI